MTEKQMKQRLYDLYQLDWMMTNGYSLANLMRSMTTIPEYHDQHITDWCDGDIFDLNAKKGMKADIEGIFKSWEFDSDAFHGECWVCFDEFCGAELTDIGYIKGLLNKVPWEEDLRDAYNKWLEDNGSEAIV